ncbi:hypothetical protein V5O48_017439 [Marasmius crinis-equi]|uniref:G-alpha-domain-containing protein n=1 Tax=Marasmius crinis-equi TaxID=585013 RepID=A0ABR3ENY7_9AGAR
MIEVQTSQPPLAEKEDEGEKKEKEAEKKAKKGQEEERRKKEECVQGEELTEEEQLWRKAGVTTAAKSSKRRRGMEVDSTRTCFSRPSTGRKRRSQSRESETSTILKTFQLYFSPQAFQEQAELWIPVIHLNLVRSVNLILNVLLPPKESTEAASSRSLSPSSLSSSAHQLDGTLEWLCFSLAVLKQVEENLTKRLTGPLSPNDATVSYHSRHARTASGSSTSTIRFITTDFTKENSTLTDLQYHPARALEVAIRSGTHSSSWKRNFSLFDRLAGGYRQSAENKTEAEEDVSNRRIAMSREEEISLKYYDILRARVHTIGAEEHRISMENSTTWARFDEDVSVVIFLAPISAFNQVLAEDRSVNRLADSMKLWLEICSNKLLASVDLILLLNKIDILDAYLKSGIRLSKYVTSYSTEKPNTVDSVSKYLLDKFSGLHHQNSPKKRKIHPYLICAVDTKATSTVIQRGG